MFFNFKVWDWTMAAFFHHIRATGMKTTALRIMCERWHRSLNRRKSVMTLLNRRTRFKKSFGIGVSHMIEDLMDRSLFHTLRSIHHNHLISNLSHHPHVVSDQHY